jgi:FtsH-binding integral membrane protein
MNVFLFLAVVGLIGWSLFQAFNKSAEGRVTWAVVAALLAGALVLLALGNYFVTVDEDGVLREFGPALPIGAILLLTGLLGCAALILRRIYRRFAARRR